MTAPTPTLDKVTNPDELRRLPEAELPQLCQDIRDFMVDTVSQTGGHLSSSLGAVELAVALHRVFNTPDDRLIWDVGHQAYAHKVLTGRRDQFSTLRQYKGLSGFPKRCESEYDAFGTAHSSTSISAALGMAIASRLQDKSDRWHIAVIGDGALTGGMAIEALSDAGVYKEGVKLLIILNDNDCSISPSVGALSSHLAKMASSNCYTKAREVSKKALRHVPGMWDLAKKMETQMVNFWSPDSQIFSNFDLNYFGPVDGHDIHDLIDVLTNIKSLNCPCVLHVATIKGKGYPRAEANPTLYHGVGKFNPAEGIVASAPSAPTYTEIFSQWIHDAAKRDPRVYAITPAMREGSGLVEYEKLFPERYRDVAIAEQHAVTYGAGLACEGMRPVVAIYSTFLQRGLDQLIHDVALQNLPVLFAVDRGGLVGADGATHQGVFDMAMLRTVPNMTIITPSHEADMYAALNTGLAMNSPVAVRYPRGKGPGTKIEDKLATLPVGKAVLKRAGRRVALLGFGSMVNQLAPIAEKHDFTLWDMRFVKPIDEAAILEAAQHHDLLVTAEEGQRMGGAGSAVMEVLSDHGCVKPVLRLGIPDRFVDHGSPEELLRELGLDSEHMESTILQTYHQLVKGQ